MECWNGWCIAGDCDGVNHVDATGYRWAERPAEVMCPVHGIYHRPDGCAHTAAVAENERWTRFQASGMMAGEFEAAEAAGRI